MKITFDIPEDLMNEMMSLTNSPTKTELIKMAISNIIQKNKIKNLTNFKGKIDLGIDLNTREKDDSF